MHTWQTVGQQFTLRLWDGEIICFCCQDTRTSDTSILLKKKKKKLFSYLGFLISRFSGAICLLVPFDKEKKKRNTDVYLVIGKRLSGSCNIWSSAAAPPLRASGGNKRTHVDRGISSTWWMKRLPPLAGAFCCGGPGHVNVCVLQLVK